MTEITEITNGRKTAAPGARVLIVRPDGVSFMMTAGRAFGTSAMNRLFVGTEAELKAYAETLKQVS